MNAGNVNNAMCRDAFLCSDTNGNVDECENIVMFSQNYFRERSFAVSKWRDKVLIKKI